MISRRILAASNPLELPRDRFEMPGVDIGLARRKGCEDLMEEGSEVGAQQSLEDAGFRRHRQSLHRQTS